MGTGGLTFAQAPPLGVPLRFFLTAPIFLFCAGLMLFSPAAWDGQRWSPTILAVVHMVALGFLAMIMMGALLQLLAVVGGAPVARPDLVARLVHGPLVLGTLLLVAGLGLSLRWPFYPALALLAFAVINFFGAVTVSLRRAAHNATVVAMATAVFALAVTQGLGLMLGVIHVNGTGPDDFVSWVDMHAAWGLLGWVFILAAGVGYQVVPMFQLTPVYPRWLMLTLVPIVIGGLLALSLALVLGYDWLQGAAILLLAAAPLAFATVTLHLQSRRRRRVSDVTLDYWRLGMACLLAAAFLGLLTAVKAPWLPTALGTLFLYGFAVSVVSGMLYKILPFLAWFHLQSQLQAHAGSIPNMKEFISEGRARRQFYTHIAALGLLLLSAFVAGPWRYAAAAGVCLSALLLAANLWGAWDLFRRHGGKTLTV